jgi:RNA polymerase sigma factor (sigma-70 family)
MRRPDITKTMELVRRAKDGDAVSLDRLIERYYERVRSIVRVRLGKRLRRYLDSGDVLQQTFKVAVESFDRFDMLDEASLINWLSKLAEHQITDAAASQNAARRNPDRVVPIDGETGDGEAQVREIEDDTTRPLDAVAFRDDRLLIEESLASIDDDYRELILLRDYAGHSWAAIAEATERPSPDAARMMYARAVFELGLAVRRRRRDASAGSQPAG